MNTNAKTKSTLGLFGKTRMLLLSSGLLVAAWFMFYVMPMTSSAQLYVGDSSLGTISTYDPNSGTLLNSSFISGFGSFGAILVSGNILYATDPSFSALRVYNAATGTLVSSFGSGGSIGSAEGLQSPYGLAVSGNTLYVVSKNFGQKVATFNATTGAPGFSFTTPLAVYGLAVSGNIIYVPSENGTISTYNATTGSVINSSFISGLSAGSPFSLAILGSSLFVGLINGHNVLEYDAATGAQIALPNPIGPNPFYTAKSIAVSGNNLYMTGLGGVKEFNATTGAVINGNFITGLSNPTALAVAPTPEPSSIALAAIGALAFLGRRTRRRRS